MPEKSFRKMIALKNGSEIESGAGLAMLEWLRNLLEQEPQHFATLFAVAQGKVDGLDKDSVLFLQDSSFLSKKGEIKPKMQNILLSAYEETPEGHVLVNPFKFTDKAEAAELERLNERAYERLFRLIIRKPPGKGGAGPSP